MDSVIYFFTVFFGIFQMLLQYALMVLGVVALLYAITVMRRWLAINKNAEIKKPSDDIKSQNL